MKDDFIGQTFPTPKGGVLTVVGIADRKSGSGNKIYQLTCSICSEDKELFPDLFESPKGDLVNNGRVPCGCSKRTKWKPFQATIITRRLCVVAGYEYLGFPEGYKNKNSKFEYNCPTHGKQEVSYHGFVNHGNRCPSCGTESMKDKLRNPEAEAIVKELCEKEGYEYLGFPEGYKNAKSKFEYDCPTHGKQTASYDNFVNGRRCPSCANHGYDQSKPGYFYLFKYEKKDHIPVYKYGITNRLTKIRSNEHIAGIKGVKSKMIYEWYFYNGSIPKNMEAYIKDNYETGISNWLTSGNTETVSANDDSFEVEAGNILMMSQMM